MKIALDAGHGPGTPGKRTPDGSLREYHFNATVAAYAADMLQAYQGVSVLLTHEDGRDVPLSERTNRANAWGADVFVSIHANAMGSGWGAANGIETFVYQTNPQDAMRLARAVQSRLVFETGLADRGVKTGDYHVLRETNMTAILVECGFMTNPQEAELLKSYDYRIRCARAIVGGIVDCYRIQKPQHGDIAGHWAEVEIREVLACGKMEGFEDGTFRPDEPVTRAQLAYLIAKGRI